MQQQQQAKTRYMNAHLDNVIALTFCCMQHKQQARIRYMNAHLDNVHCTYILLDAAAATSEDKIYECSFK